MASQTTAGTRSQEETTIIDTAAAAAADRAAVPRAEAATAGAYGAGLCDISCPLRDGVDELWNEF